MSFFEDFVDKIVEAGLADRSQIIGCNDAEIRELEDAIQLQLPENYKEFLRNMGKQAGSFLVGTDWMFDELLTLQEAAQGLLQRNGLQNIVSAHTFVFLMHQGYQFLSFECGDSPDPPVYRYIDGEPFSVTNNIPCLERVSDSFTESITIGLEEQIALRKRWGFGHSQ